MSTERPPLTATQESELWCSLVDGLEADDPGDVVAGARAEPADAFALVSCICDWLADTLGIDGLDLQATCAPNLATAWEGELVLALSGERTTVAAFVGIDEVLDTSMHDDVMLVTDCAQVLTELIEGLEDSLARAER